MEIEEQQVQETSSVTTSQTLDFSREDIVNPSLIHLQIAPGIMVLSLNLFRIGWGCAEMRELFSHRFGSTLHELQVDFGQNKFGDEGHSVFTNWVSQNPTSLEVLKVNFNATGLRSRSVSILTILNHLRFLRVLRASFSQNSIVLEQEVKSVVGSFKDPKAFGRLESLSITFDDVLTESVKPLNKLSSSSQNEGNNLTIVREATIRLQELTKRLSNFKMQFSQLIAPTNDVQAQYDQAIKTTMLQITHYENCIAKVSTSSQQKTILGRLLELMLRFSTSLLDFEISIPGKLLDTHSFTQFAELLKLKQRLTRFSLTTTDVISISNNSSDQFFYQLGKIQSLTEIELNFNGLNLAQEKNNQILHLARFLHPLENLQCLSLRFPHMHQMTEQSCFLIDVASLLGNLKSTQLGRCFIDLSFSKVTDEIFNQIAQGLFRFSHLKSMSVSLKECELISEKSILTTTQLVSIAQYNKLNELTVDFSQSSAVARSNAGAGESLLLAITEKFHNSLTKLQLNLAPHRANGASLTDSSVQLLLQNLPYLNKCQIHYHHSSSKTARIFKAKAEQNGRLIVAASALGCCQYLTTKFRKEVLFDILEFLN